MRAACTQLAESLAWRASLGLDTLPTAPFPDAELLNTMAPSMCVCTIPTTHTQHPVLSACLPLVEYWVAWWVAGVAGKGALCCGCQPAL